MKLNPRKNIVIIFLSFLTMMSKNSNIKQQAPTLFIFECLRLILTFFSVGPDSTGGLFYFIFLIASSKTSELKITDNERYL